MPLQLDPEPVAWSPSTRAEPWTRRTIRELGHDESFLEERIAEQPLHLLGLDRFQFGGPLAVFRQRSFQNPQQREVIPDLLLLSLAGHVAIVEVKLADNPELRDRRIVAQVVDYAGTLCDCDEDDLLEALAGTFTVDPPTSWMDLVARSFPKLTPGDAAHLASRFIRNIRSGNLQLVIACDSVPSGLREMVAALSRPAALDFRLQVAEIATYAREGSEELLLIPTTPMRTEVVARTVVTVVTAAGQSAPTVEVSVTPLEELEARLASTRKGESRNRWTEADFVQALKGLPDEVVGLASWKLYTALKAVALRARFGTGKAPSFSPRLAGFGSGSPVTLWADGSLSINYGYIWGDPSAVSAGEVLAKALGAKLGDPVPPDDRSPRYPRYESAVWVPHVDEFVKALTRTS